MEMVAFSFFSFFVFGKRERVFFGFCLNFGTMGVRRGEVLKI